MTDRDADLTCDESVPALVAAALLSHDLPGATDDDLAIATAEINDSVAAMPDFTRFGVTIAGGAVYAVLSAMGRKPFRQLSAIERSRLARRLMSHRLPILGEFGALTRGLGLVSVFEAHTQDADTVQASH